MTSTSIVGLAPLKLPEQCTADIPDESLNRRVRTAGLIHLLIQRSCRWDFLKTAQSVPWATDGEFAVLLPPKEWCVIRKHIIPNPDMVDRKVLSVEQIIRCLPKEKTVQPRPARITGYRSREDNGRIYKAFLMQGLKRRREMIETVHFQIIAGRWENADFYLNREPLGPILIRNGDRPVGVLCPLITGLTL